MLTTFNDGTFAWGCEGTFYRHIPAAINSRMSVFLKSIYHRGGTRYNYFLTFEQIVWITVLLGAFISTFHKTEGSKEKYICILWLAIIGLTLFEMLFEVRARYLYTHIPIYCILATLGIKNILEFTSSKINWLISKRSK